MAAEWYMNYAGVEIVNHSRLGVYLDTVGSPLTEWASCGCPSFDADVLDQLPYTTPDDPDNPAPWYDPDVPESMEFAGIMVLDMAGMDDHPVQRTVTGGIAGGGAIGPARALPRTITVTALILGTTCCGAEYGRHWLSQALQGCTGSDCDGECLTVYNCCPGGEATAALFNARHRRTLRRVALIDGPHVTAKSGTGCGTGRCQSGADVITVEFVLTAAVPWLWTDPMPVLEVAPPLGTGAECVSWCLHGADDAACAGGCRFAECPDPTALCADTRCMPALPPTAGIPLSTCFCLPLAVERNCYTMDLSGRPNWSSDVPVITIRAGATEIRNLTIEIFESVETLTCEESADENRCTPHSSWTVMYVPAGGAVTLDGQTGRVTVECGGRCEASPDVYGRDGLPPTFNTLDCASYCVCISSDVANPPSADAVITLNVSGKGF